jgi:riboflavin biosynthesis pyrimidine reductase
MKGPSRLPWVLIDAALSADGKLLSAVEEQTVIAGTPRPPIRAHFATMEADAVMCDANKLTGASVTSRPAGRGRREKPGPLPLRVLVAVSGTLDACVRASGNAEESAVVLTTAAIANDRRTGFSPRVPVKTFGRRNFNFRAALAWLRSEWNVRRMVCRGGSTLNAALLAADLVDELHLRLYPTIRGGATAPTLADGITGAMRLADARRWHLRSVQRQNAMLYLVYERKLRRNNLGPHRGRS